MTQGVLPFKYEEEKNDTGMTALAGLPIYLDLAKVIGLSKSIKKHLKIRTNSQGWTDTQVVVSLILLNLAGGTSVEDLKVLEADTGFCQILSKSETHGLRRKVRRVLERRWRKEKKRTLPSPSAAFRYLSCFHDPKQEQIRDGNVPAGFNQLRVFKKALDCLPEGVEKVKLRSDTAGYQHDLLKYCEKAVNKRFGKIEFAVDCNVTQAFKIAVEQIPDSQWHPICKNQIKTGSEWAEVCFVPNELCYSKNAPEYGYLAKRQILKDQQLPGMEEAQISLPFPTMKIETKRYKVFGIVTNIKEMYGEDLIHWLHKRCGRSEQVHSVMKADLSGGKLPSSDFGVNAAWWWIMIMSLNLNVMMKNLALAPSMVNKRMKAIRFSIINIPGRIIQRCRSLFLRLPKGHPSYNILVEARRRIAMLQGAWAPPG